MGLATDQHPHTAHSNSPHLSAVGQAIVKLRECGDG